MSKLVTIYGGSGFVGRYIARRLAKAGWRVRVAVRRPNEAMHVKTYGSVGQVEPIFCNIRDDGSVRAAMIGSDVVVNCVGTREETGQNGFDLIQHEGAGRVARLATELNVARLVHVSAIGADIEAQSLSSQTKAMGEQAIQAHFPEAVILRPSAIFGAEDRFFNRFASKARFGPVLVIAGGDSKVQPVYVEDVARAVELAVEGKAAGVYELGGPEIHTMREIADETLAVIRRNRLVFNLAPRMARIVASLGTLTQKISLGIVKTPFSRDEVRALQVDNVVSDGAQGFGDLGIVPTAAGAVLPDYLWRFRPSGQYAAIKESAKNLKA